MRRFINIITVLVVTAIFGKAFAQDAITLEACREQAVEFNKQLKKAELQKGEAEAYLKVAKTSYLPSISAEASLMFRPQEINVSLPAGPYLSTATSVEAAENGDFNGVAYAQEMNLIDVDYLSLINGGLSLTQPIYTGGKIRYANKQAELGVVMAKNNYALQHDEVIALTDKAFWQVATVEANIELAQSYLNMLTELEEQMNRMYELGLTPQSEKLKVSVQKNEIELQLFRAQNGLKVAKMNLNQVIGQPLNNEIKIKYDFSNLGDISVQDGIQMAITNRNELKLMQNQVDMAKYDKKITQADYLPTIGVKAQYSTFYVKDLYEETDFNPSISGQISIPLFGWGQGKQKQKAAEFAIQQQQAELDRTQELISLEVASIQSQLLEAREEINLAEKNIEEAEESLEETESSFEVGLNSITDLLNAQTNLQNAKLQLITSKANYKLLETSWQKVTGTLSK